MKLNNLEKIEISQNDLHDIINLFEQDRFECHPMSVDSFCKYIFNLYEPSPDSDTIRQKSEI